MTPREFYNRNGLPIVTAHNLPFGTTLTVPVELDRYLLGIIVGTSAVNVSVTPAGETPIVSFNLAANSNTFWTHALHGAFVNMEFRITSTGAAGINIVKAYIIPDTDIHPIRKRGWTDAIAQALRFRGRSGEQSGARPEPATATTPLFNARR